MSEILTGRTYGERPPSYFAPVPVSEIAILAGAIGAVVGVASGAKAALIVGIAVCILGVLEFTVREHFSGYRSHASLLAALPAAGIVALSVAVFGTPRQRGTRELLLGAAVPAFALFFWLLRKRFLAARQGRIVRPPGG
jgi:hypothetical protein